MNNYDIEMIEKRRIFIETGQITEGVKPYIAESWKRCKKLGINTEVGQGLLENNKKFNEIMEKNRELIIVGTEVIKNVKSSFKSNESIVFITDSQGYILVVDGGEEISKKCNSVNLKSGVKWTEEVIGTNAVDLAIMYDKVMEVRGSEHYCENHKDAVCISVPIHAQNTSIVGCCTVVLDIHVYTKIAIGLAISATHLIEKEIQLKNFLNIMYKSFNKISECMIVTDSKLCINHINNQALSVLNAVIDDIVGKEVNVFLNNIDLKTFRKSYYNKNIIFENKGRTINCIGNIEKIDFNKYTYGYLLVFKEEKAYNKMINKFVGNQSTYTFDDIITQSDTMLETISYAKRISQIDCSVLITGESGTGKELFAHSIHSASNKRKGPFVAINCAALPKDLVESEIFGYEEGSFTGAKKGGARGKFELADGGTLFLDEIGELPLEVQSKLLRVLDNHKVIRIGGKTEKNIDVRVIGATNRDLEKEVKENNFRLDLYYRINVVNVEIPSLNNRKGDISLLAEKFLSKLNFKDPSRNVIMTKEFLDKLEIMEFPGNIRQLQNIISRAYYLTEDDILKAKHLPNNSTPKNELKDEAKKNIKLEYITAEDIEHKLIVDALDKSKGNISNAAKLLNISRSSIYRRMNKYGIKIDKLTNI